MIIENRSIFQFFKFVTIEFGSDMFMIVFMIIGQNFPKKYGKNKIYINTETRRVAI